MDTNTTLNLDLWTLIQQGAISTYPAAALLRDPARASSSSGRGACAASSVRRRSSRATWCPCWRAATGRAPSTSCASIARVPARRVYSDLIEGERDVPLPELERVATERSFEEVQGAGSNLWVLGTIGSSAPFIGLFGTVLGIIRAFHAIALAGTGGFAVVAAGISEALIATALGLAVGIVAVIFYNYFQSRVDRIDAALRIGSGRVLEAVSAGRRVPHGVQ